MRLFFPLVLDAVRDVVCKIYKEGVIFNIRVIMYICLCNVFILIFHKYLLFNSCPGDDGDVLTCLQVGHISLFFQLHSKSTEIIDQDQITH